MRLSMSIEREREREREGGGGADSQTFWEEEKKKGSEAIYITLKRPLIYARVSVPLKRSKKKTGSLRR